MEASMSREPRPRIRAEATSAADARLDALIGSRFDSLMATWPSRATYLGIHAYDDSLADLSRSAMEADIAAEARFISQLEGSDPALLSDGHRFERDLALHGARLRHFEAEVIRGWQRGASASHEIGDALFLLLVRDFAPLEERLASLTRRLEAVPEALRQARDRLGREPVRLWNELEMDAARELPSLVHEIVSAGRERWPPGSTELARLERAAGATRQALLEYEAWIGSTLEDANGEVPLGAEAMERLIELRALEGLDGDAILALGQEQLEAMHGARREAASAIHPRLSEAEAVDRVKADGPADFDEALRAYREAMVRARRFIAEHDLATLPEGDSIEVMATPLHMRSLIPLAAYFEPAVFDRPIHGVYVVTPSLDGDPRAMREHNWASIVNTSVHEAYPGHHLQFAAALASPTPARLLSDAPDFHEGWAMYCEQMMLEAGFEDTPARRVIVATDAIWRACRIILDIRLHRGEVGLDEAMDFLAEHTGFERAVARAEVNRYTQTPAYNLSYLLGKLLLLRLREDRQAQLGPDFDVKGFHDALLYSGNLPVSFQRRLLAGESGGPTPPGV